MKRPNKKPSNDGGVYDGGITPDLAKALDHLHTLYEQGSKRIEVEGIHKVTGERITMVIRISMKKVEE